MENKYYAVMELTQEKDGETKTYAYVTAKCTLVGKNEISLCTGRQQTNSLVVFEWNENQDNIQPIYNNGECVNAVTVSQIFDNAYDCKKYTSILNDELIRKEISLTSAYYVRDMAKILRTNQEKAKALQDSHLSTNQEIIK